MNMQHSTFIDIVDAIKLPTESLLVMVLAVQNKTFFEDPAG